MADDINKLPANPFEKAANSEDRILGLELEKVELQKQLTAEKTALEARLAQIEARLQQKPDNKDVDAKLTDATKKQEGVDAAQTAVVADTAFTYAQDLVARDEQTLANKTAIKEVEGRVATVESDVSGLADTQRRDSKRLDLEMQFSENRGKNSIAAGLDKVRGEFRKDLNEEGLQRVFGDNQGQAHTDVTYRKLQGELKKGLKETERKIDSAEIRTNFHTDAGVYAVEKKVDGLADRTKGVEGRVATVENDVGVLKDGYFNEKVQPKIAKVEDATTKLEAAKALTSVPAQDAYTKLAKEGVSRGKGANGFKTQNFDLSGMGLNRALSLNMIANSEEKGKANYITKAQNVPKEGMAIFRSVNDTFFTDDALADGATIRVARLEDIGSYRTDGQKTNGTVGIVVGQGRKIADITQEGNLMHVKITDAAGNNPKTIHIENAEDAKVTTIGEDKHHQGMVALKDVKAGMGISPAEKAKLVSKSALDLANARSEVANSLNIDGKTGVTVKELSLFDKENVTKATKALGLAESDTRDKTSMAAAINNMLPKANKLVNKDPAR